MIPINWFAVTIMFIWLCGMIATIWTKRDHLEICFWITLFMGVGYHLKGCIK